MLRAYLLIKIFQDSKCKFQVLDGSQSLKVHKWNRHGQRDGHTEWLPEILLKFFFNPAELSMTELHIISIVAKRVRYGDECLGEGVI